jgi:hypothetical protein
MKTIQLKWDQLTASGSWADIYRLSSRRVVKVFRKAYRKHEDALIKDEMRGARSYRHALPVIRVVDVVTPEGRRARGMVKRHVPNGVRVAEVREFYERSGEERPSDFHQGNYRKDSRGRIWLVDTQVDPK